jgi:hypothetical protein
MTFFVIFLDIPASVELIRKYNMYVQSRPSKSERFFNSVIFTLNHRRPKMSQLSQFDTY